MCQAPKSYKGSGPFVFVSYSHENKDFVYEDITRLQALGINIWYDEGLPVGETWYSAVEEHIERANCFGVLFYVSEVFLKSESVWREVNILNRHEKKDFFSTLLDDVDMHRTITMLFMDNKFKEVDGSTPIEIFQSMYRYFNNDITYAKARAGDSERIGKIKESITRWGYSGQMEKFPLGNVLHSGHIEYLPSLLEATPFNFTYVTISDQLMDIDKSLNSLTGVNRVWSQCSLDEFLLKREPIPGDIIVSFIKQQINRIPEILSVRREYNPRSALLINICVENIEKEGPEASRIAQTLIDGWNSDSGTDSDLLFSGRNDYCLLQTDQKIVQLKSVEEVLNLRNPLERWRYLLSDKVFFADVVSEYNANLTNRKGASWLLRQRILGGDSSFNAERNELEADPAVCDHWDWQKFREYRYDWEV